MRAKTNRQIGVALYGCGTVGTAVAEIIAARSDWLKTRHGISLSLRHIVVRDLERERASIIDRALLNAQVEPGVRDPRVEIVVEAIGGTDVAGAVVRAALQHRKHVVTANKALLATDGRNLEELARQNGVLLRYEAAVGGAIPVLQTLRNALAGSHVTRLRGILNGTTNYILTRMAEDGLPFFRALAKTQALGYAEADPRADVTGVDAAQKLIILARHAFAGWVSASDVKCRGIDHVSLADVARAQQEQKTLKLIAEAVREDGVLKLSVQPVALPASDALANVRNELNALEIESDYAGSLFLQGRGAGGHATASAVYSDIVEAALALPASQRSARKRLSILKAQRAEPDRSQHSRTSASTTPATISSASAHASGL
ncbi:MAG: homoserine dehydrogenase [Gemmatimonadota bacterium]